MEDAWTAGDRDAVERAGETMMRYGSELRLLVVGGGIAGLTLAAALEQRGMHAEVIERAHVYGGIGYVLGLWPAGLNVLYSLGLREDLAKVGLPCGMYYARDLRDRLLLGANFDAFAPQYGDNLFLGRADLIDTLHKAVRAPVTFGRSVTKVQQSPEAVTVTFDDGSTREYDAVIGADGLRSPTRHLLFGQVPLSYHGITGWAFWTNVEIGSDTREFYGRGRFMGLYPSKERPCCFAAVTARRDEADDPDTRRERLDRLFSDFPELPRAALRSSTDATIWHDDFLDVRIPRWVSGRVALVGDAAHAVLPTAGVGASMAIESAYVLADELSRSSSVTVPDGLRRYERRHRTRADSIQRQSRQMAWMIRVNNSLTVGARDTLMRAIPSSVFLAMFKPLMYSAI